MKAIFRTLLVLEWIFLIAAVAAGIAGEDQLPEPLQAWLEADDSALSPATGALFAIVLLGSLVGTVGLFLLKRWAAWLYLGSNLLAVFSTWSPTVQHPLETILADLALLVAGAVIGISFFSPLLRRGDEAGLPPKLSTS